MTAVQQELFKHNWGREFLDTIGRRIGGRDILTVSEAAEVMDKSNNTIIALCDQGELVSVNVSTGSRREIDIHGKSIVQMYARKLGVNQEG